MTNQPIEEKWKIDLASHKLESDEGAVIPLYVAEDFIENLLEQERRRMSDEIRNTDTSELYDGDGETHSGWEQAKKYFLSIINK